MELILTCIVAGLSVTVLILAAVLTLVIIKAKRYEREAVLSQTVSAINDAIKTLEESNPLRAELTELKAKIERFHAMTEKLDRLSAPEADDPQPTKNEGSDTESQRPAEELERLQGFYDTLKKKEMALRGAIKEASRELSLACGTDSLEYLIEAVNKTVDSLAEALKN